MAFWGNITLWSEQMKTLLPAIIAAAACVLLSSAGMAGQPGTSNGVNCGTTAFNTPGGGNGGSGSSQSPFAVQPPGGTQSVSVYANALTGGGNNSQATSNPKATSQYDIACLRAQTP